MHARLKYVKPINKRLASGEIVTYYYHRVTGKRIHGTPGTAGFLASYERASTIENREDPNSIAGLVAAFRGSGVFDGLRDRTRKDYEKHLDLIVEKFGDCEIAAFNDRRIRRDIIEWRDGLAKRSNRQADYAVAVLSRTLQWGYDAGQLSVNHAMRAGKLYKADRSDNVWSAAEIDAMFRVAHETVLLPFRLALDTGQRQGDLLALTWKAYDGEALTLRQSKGKRRVYVPLIPELTAILDRLPRTAVTILTNRKGRPWTADGFRTMFDRAKRAAGVTDRTFHDCRGTFVTRATLRGLTPQEIATVTGHSVREVERIIDTYLARSPELARSAMRKYESGT